MIHRMLAVILVSLVVGCASARPDPFLNPENQLTYEQGEEILRNATAMIADGKRQISDGRDLRDRADDMIKEGQERQKTGEEMAIRGRNALRAARMLEEAEALQREGGALKKTAFPE